MNGKITVRNGFFSKECNYSYNSGYITQVNCLHEQRASYDDSIKDIKIKHHYTTKVKMNDFETREELKITFPFKTELSHNDMATIFYVDDYNKDYQIPVGLYNHETDSGYVENDLRTYIGFRLLNVGRFRRGVAWVVNIIEHLIAFAIVYGVSFSFLQNGFFAFVLGLLFAKLVWFPVGFVSNLFFPSYFGAKRAYAKFDEEICRIGKEEMNKSRQIKQKLAAMNDPLRVLKDMGVDFGGSNQAVSNGMVQGIGPASPPPQNAAPDNGGFKPMF